MSSRPGQALRWLLGLIAAGTLLRLAARGELAGPPLGSLDQLTAWADTREPAVVAVALVRLAAEASVWYVLALSVLHAASSALRIVGGHRLAEALALPGLRRVVHAGLGLGLAATSTVGAQEEVAAPGVATMAPVTDAALTLSTPGGTTAGTATMRPQPPRREVGTATMAPTVTPSTWTVAPGESFWSIAEELLTEAWHRTPSGPEVDAFWRALVEVNRSRLTDPTDADLIQPGQVFEVPSVPPPST